MKIIFCTLWRKESPCILWLCKQGKGCQSFEFKSACQKDAFILIFMMVIVPLAGELKFYPVNETFRISFGAPAFFFCLLLLRKSRPLLPGFLTGAAIVIFRVGLDLIQQNADLASSFYQQFPSFFFYFTYAFLFLPSVRDALNSALFSLGSSV